MQHTFRWILDMESNNGLFTKRIPTYFTYRNRLANPVVCLWLWWDNNNNNNFVINNNIQQGRYSPKFLVPIDVYRQHRVIIILSVVRSTWEADDRRACTIIITIISYAQFKPIIIVYTYIILCLQWYNNLFGGRNLKSVLYLLCRSLGVLKSKTRS